MKGEKARVDYLDATVAVPCTEYGWLRNLLAAITFQVACEVGENDYLQPYADQAVRECLHMLDFDKKLRAERERARSKKVKAKVVPLRRRAA